MSFKIGERLIGKEYSPFVVAEIGINHEGSYEKAVRMINDACATFVKIPACSFS